MKASRLLVSGLLLAGLLQIPQNARAADPKLVEIERDVFDLSAKLDNVTKAQKAQDEQIAALMGLVQQLLDANKQTAQNQASLQQGLGEGIKNLNDQQGKMAIAIGALETRVGQMASESSGVSQSLDALSRKISGLGTKLDDVSNTVRTLPTPATPPVATGPSPEALFESARRDLSSGKDMLAMDEFINYLQLFPKGDDAPKAQYNVGYIYDRAQDYDNAVKAYDAVIERYGDGQWRRDAMFNKAMALKNGDHRTEAVREFKQFVTDYPGDERVDQANVEIKKLGMTPKAPGAGKGKQRP